MDVEKAKVMCKSNGSSLLIYESGNMASLVLPSGENFTISIGFSSVKVFIKKSRFSLKLPKQIASKPILDWDSDYNTHNNIQRRGMKIYMLDGLISIVSQYKDLQQLVSAWPLIENPIGIGAMKNMGIA